MAKRVTKAEKELRVSLVVNLLLRSATKSEILRFSAKSGWGLASRTIDDYIAEATQIIKEQGQKRRVNAFDRHLAQLHKLILLAYDKNDLNLVRNLLRDEADLLGLNQPDQLDINVNDTRTNEDRVNRIFELVEQVRPGGDRPLTQ